MKDQFVRSSSVF